MPDVMLQLGDYQFSIDTAAYQQLSRSTAYRWQSQERTNSREALQYTGPGADEITLQGVVYPQYKAGPGQLEAMREQANVGRPLILVDGLGNIHGRWVILAVDETQEAFTRDGTPRKQSFTLRIKKYADDLQD